MGRMHDSCKKLSYVFQYPFVGTYCADRNRPQKVSHSLYRNHIQIIREYYNEGNSHDEERISCELADAIGTSRYRTFFVESYCGQE
jgi:hypothetical protein